MARTALLLEKRRTFQRPCRRQRDLRDGNSDGQSRAAKSQPDPECHTQFTHEHHRWRKPTLCRHDQAVVVAGCFAIGLKGGRDRYNGAPCAYRLLRRTAWA
jgi:hypothetical protein